MPKLENQVIALRGGSVEWTRLKKGRDGWEPDAAGRMPLPEGGDPLRLLAQPDAGVSAALDATVRAMLGRHATVVLPGSAAIQRLVNLPATDPRELAGMVDLQIDSLSPFPPETVCFSHEILETGESSSRVLIAIIQKSVIDQVGAAFRGRGLSVDSLTLSTLGWWDRLRRKPGLLEGGRRVILVAENRHCDLIVADDGAPILFRSHSLLEGLTEAEFAQDIAEETVSALTALELEHGALPVTDVQVWQAPDGPPDLASALSAAGGWSIHAESLEALGSLTEGVAMRESLDTPLDLVPPEWRAAEKDRQVKRRLAMASAAIACLWVLCVAGVLVWQEVNARRLVRTEAFLAEVKPAAQEVRDARRRVQALSLYGDIQRSALECLREVTALMPAGVELNQYTFEKGKAIALSGEAPSSQPVYDFKKALDGSTLFYGTELQGPVRNRNRETFRIAIALQEAAE